MLTTVDDILDRAIVAQFPCIIKAHEESRSNRRIVECEASNESLDADGDVVLQSSLLSAAVGFVKSGHLDIDHLSEFGARMGIPDPSSYIVGRPLSVRAGDGKSTFVEGEISRSLDGQVDPAHNRYDEFWMSLRRDPPVVWFASIYGWPTDLDDCTEKSCPGGATRYVIKALDWRSLAFTRTPKNTSLHGSARIVTAKSYMMELAKSMQLLPVPTVGSAATLPPTVDLPQTIGDAAQPCPNCGVHEAPSLLGYRKHFSACKGCGPGMSDILAHACMHRHHMMVASAPQVMPTAPAIPTN